ncbi:hypothetical protein HYX58_03100 [Candidatus Dependentiae bacterium]|nr:hypothetical protein [Candidatus Dependentiae bacterium]
MKPFFSPRVFSTLFLLAGAQLALSAMNPFLKPRQYQKSKSCKPKKVFIELVDFTDNNYFLHKGWYDVQDLRDNLSKEAIEKAGIFFKDFMRLSKAHQCSASLMAFQKLGINKISNFKQAQELKNIIYELTSSACCLPVCSPTDELSLRKKAGIE